METVLPLTARQLRELRALIDQRREALLAELREDTERVREPGAGDEPVAALTADADELEALDSALSRMDARSYGTCADCAAEIGFERLQAWPAAARCLACQARHEKTYR